MTKRDLPREIDELRSAVARLVARLDELDGRTGGLRRIGPSPPSAEERSRRARAAEQAVRRAIETIGKRGPG